MEFTLIESDKATMGNARIKVVGVGGGGGNALDHMMNNRIEGVDFVAVNTDMQVLNKSMCSTKIQLGRELTAGLGAGANPEVGRHAAEESRAELEALMDDTDMVFITAGMGGGTGTGAAPIIAEIAKSKGVLTVAVVTKPFPHEGSKRMQVAMTGLNALRECVDSLIVIPNEKLLTVLDKDTTILSALAKANEVLYCSVQGIAELITREGLINLDFADVKTVMSEMGSAMMGSGTCSGDNRAYEATQAAISNPLLEDINLKNARGVLVNVTAGEGFTIQELQAVGECIEELAHDDANVVTGMVIDPAMHEDVRVTLVATGLQDGNHRAQAPASDSLGQQSVVTPKVAPVTAHADDDRSQTHNGSNGHSNGHHDHNGNNGNSNYDSPTISRRQSSGDEGETMPEQTRDSAQAPVRVEPQVQSRTQTEAQPRVQPRVQPQAQTSGAHFSATEADESADKDKYGGYLDIPSFLRDQAD